MVFFGWAYVQADRAHVRVVLFYSRFPPRVQPIVGFITSFLALVLFSLIIWQGIAVGIRLWEAGRVIDIIFVSVAFFQFFVPFGALFVCLVLITQMVEYISEMRRVD